MNLGLYRSAVYARQRAQKQRKAETDFLAEGEHAKPPKGVQLSSNDGVTKGEEGGLDALQRKKEKYELSSLVKSIKMKSKQVKLASDDKTKIDGKLQSKGTKKRKL